MKFICPLIVVSDINRAKQFYKQVLGLEVQNDFGANVVLTGGVALQTKESWLSFIDIEDKNFKTCPNDSELYFEEDDFDSFIDKLSKISEIDYVHKTIEHRWGQRVVRFYDPDKHIIEVGEIMSSVVKRFIDNGMTIEQIAERMDISTDYVKECLKNK